MNSVESSAGWKPAGRTNLRDVCLPRLVLPLSHGLPIGNRRWSLDILRTGLNPALDPTLNPAAGVVKSNEIRMFSLEKLKVYDRALACVANLALLSAHWDRRHAVADQLLRASESVVLNIGEGARLRSGPQRQHILDYAIGSASECAACLDIAQCKQWLLQSEALHEKRVLCEVVKMLFGLRRAWRGDELHERPEAYGEQEPWLFAHERLEAYQCSLKVVAWFHALPGGAELSTRWFRQLDKVVTSTVLNIAEGNGRRMEADRGRFFESAESSAVKANTYIQLSQRAGEMSVETAQCGLELLGRVAVLTRGLAENT
jgi:four helix bundle protein